MVRSLKLGLLGAFLCLVPRPSANAGVGTPELCYVDRENVDCIDAISRQWAEGYLDAGLAPAKAVLSCGACTQNMLGNYSCPNGGNFWPNAMAGITLRFALSFPSDPSGNVAGKKSYTEGSIVDCGELWQCDSDCFVIIVGGQTTYQCKKHLASNNLAVRERVPSGDDCKALVP